MELIEQLELIPARDRVIALVGAGGKTTLLYLLARLFARRGLAVAVTTTTHIFCPDEPDFTVITEGIVPLPAGRITVCGTPCENGKLSAPAPETLADLSARAEILLVEADGSRRFPLKLPAVFEPVLPPQTDRVIALAGLTALGRPLGEVCHRAVLAQEALGITPEQIVTPALLAELLLHGYGALPQLSILLNQADTPALRHAAEETTAILHRHGMQRVLITSLLQEAEKIC